MPERRSGETRFYSDEHQGEATLPVCMKSRIIQISLIKFQKQESNLIKGVLLTFKLQSIKKKKRIKFTT